MDAWRVAGSHADQRPVRLDLATRLDRHLLLPLVQADRTCSQELGISVATIATKLSMAIPVLVLALADGIFDIAWGQWLGLGLAFPAVWLSARAGEPAEPREQKSASSALWWMPVVMFVGSGCIDLVFGWYSTDASLDAPGMQMAFASVPFTLGGVVGLAHQIQLGHGLPSGRDVIGGILLGVTNFASLYFLLLAFDADLLARAMVVPHVEPERHRAGHRRGRRAVERPPQSKSPMGRGLGHRVHRTHDAVQLTDGAPVDRSLVCVLKLRIATCTLHWILPSA